MTKVTMAGYWPSSYCVTVEPRYNDLQYNNIPRITINIFSLSPAMASVTV